MKLSAFSKFASGGFEALLAIPFIGGSIVVFSGYSALSIALVLHIITLLIAFTYRTAKLPSVSGLVAVFLGWIPVVGWILHTIAAVWILASAFRDAAR
ncbi:hypothetical protein [Alkalicoccus urumqiensis]|uniref:Uncharacterized protein n=1 Tax=Alkalicoccus urumqiensis TaxID=1548213 RepID=A0A2P6MLY6_ALKUR|nr:hypothetical protein [Alkalicoccus urumqiensis]PRO67299.1 hypothetical protein C6I21_01710 [Alkalicoccus urumqiensis]